MSILGRGELIERIRKDDVVVSPLLSQEQIGAASIDLRVGNIPLTVRARGTSHTDPAAAKATISTGTDHDAEVDRQQKHERHEIPFLTKFLLHPGSLALVPTLKWLQLPDNVHGWVTARSTWAREGLSIATATFIEPRYQGVVTLKLANMGQIPIKLYPGLRIAQIAFDKMDGSTIRPNKG
jgi:dCTP deaminase